MGGGSWEGEGTFGGGSGVHESASIAGSDFDYLHAPGGALYLDIGVCVCVCVCVCVLCMCVCVYSTRISILIPTVQPLNARPTP